MKYYLFWFAGEGAISDCCEEGEEFVLESSVKAAVKGLIEIHGKSLTYTIIYGTKVKL